MTDADTTSPLARLRATYEARQEADPARYVDIWSDGDLVARVARPPDDIKTARGIMRTMAALVEPQDSDRLVITPEDLADILVAATVSLHARNGDPTAEPDPIPGPGGLPLRFDQSFGEVIGVPEIGTPRAAVFAAFTKPAHEGGPPVLDTLELLRVTTNVCNVLLTGRQAAQETVGKASPLAIDATQP